MVERRAGVPPPPDSGDPDTPIWTRAVRAPEPPPSPQLQIGRFEILEELGRGGMGVVYRARDPLLAREVALKTLRGSTTEAARRHLLREARSVAGLDHPGIVALYECHDDGDRIFLTMRLVVGPSLARLAAGRMLPPMEAARIAAAVGRALAYAHGRGIVHRDIKPANILMEDDHPLLADFGLARPMAPEADPPTVDAELIGTPAYMAPEQVRLGTDAATPASDQYALGVVLYEMLSGRRPFVGEGPTQVLAAILSGRIADLPREIPTDLAEICTRAMAARPSDRFPSAAHMAEALERWRRGEPVSTRPERLAHQVARSARARSTLALAFAGVALLVPLGWHALKASGRDQRAEQLRETMEGRTTALLAQGHPSEADAVFAAFAALPESAGTPALFTGWLAQARRLQDRGAGADAIAAFSTAYALAPDDTSRLAALTGLAADLRAQERWEPLRSVLAMMDRQRAHPAEIRPLERDLAILDRDFAAASQANDDPDQGVLIQFLSRATSTGQRASYAVAVDTDGDGHPEIGLQQGAALPFFTPGRWTAPIATWNVSGLDPPIPLLPSRSATLPGKLPLVLKDASGCALATPTPDGLQPGLRWPCAFPFGFAAGDLDGDGVTEGYVADGRTLLELPLASPGHPEDGPIAEADASLANANSEIRGVRILDADGDGKDDLVVASGGWRSYDLRVYNRTSQGLALRARARVGDLQSLAVLRSPDGPLLAVLLLHDPAEPVNRLVFRPGAPQGARRGIHLLSLDSAGLHARGFIPLPALPATLDAEEEWAAKRILVGDIDGDGWDEIAIGRDQTSTGLFRRDASGAWTGTTVAGFTPLLFAGVDGDGDDELLMRAAEDGAVWAVGTGTGALPKAHQELPQTAAPPPGLQGTLRKEWERAEALASLGVPKLGAARLRALAALDSAPAVVGAALLRAGQLLEAADDRAGARQTYAEVSQDPLSAASALDALLRIDLAERRFSDAVAVARKRLDLPDPPVGLAAQVGAMAGREVPQRVYDFTQPQPAWRIDTPIGAARDQEGLMLRAASTTRLLHLPVHREQGEALRIALEVDDRSIDWSGRFEIGLATPGGGARMTAISIAMRGGGGIFHRNLTCAFAPEGDGAGYPGPGLKTIAWESGPDGGSSCAAVQNGAETGRIVYTLPQGKLPSGDLDLVVSTEGDGTLSEVVLKRIEISGLTARPEAAAPEAAANSLLMAGEPGQALQALEGHPDLATAVALVGLGRAAEAGRVLAALPAATRDSQLRTLLLLAPDQYAAPVRMALGRRYFSEFRQAWDTQAVVYPDATSWEVAMTTQLDGVEGSPVDEADALDRSTLLLWRARAWRGRGDPALAGRDLDLGLRRASNLSGADAAEIRAELLVEKALNALDQGASAAAMAAIESALAQAPSPEIFADQLAARTDLDALHGETGWVRVVARRGIGASDLYY